jgi:hypothetical protein
MKIDGYDGHDGYDGYGGDDSRRHGEDGTMYPDPNRGGGDDFEYENHAGGQ